MSFNMSGNPWIYIFIVLFLAALLAIGFIASKKAKSADDYAMARNSYPWFTISFVIMASAASGVSFLGNGGMCYSFGWPVLWYLIGYPFGEWLTISLMGGYGTRLNRMGVRSLSEYGGKRFNSRAIRLMMAVGTMAMLFSLSSQFTSVATLLEIIFELRYVFGLMIAAALVMAYITMGGAHADMMANTMQGTVMVIAAICCMALFFQKIGEFGGFTAFAQQVYNVNPALAPSTVFTDPNLTKQYANSAMVFFIVTSHCGYAFMPFISLRLAALDKLENMPKTLIFGALIGLICAVGSALPGLVAILDMPDLVRPDWVIPAMFIKNLPDWLAAFLIIGIFCAIISTASGMFLGMAQAIGNDVYRLTLAPKLGHSPEKTESITKIVVRVALLGVAIVGILMVATPPAYLSLFGWIGNGINVSILAPVLIASLLYRKSSNKAVILSVIINVAVYAYLYIGQKWTGIVASGLCTPLGIILVVVLSQFFKDDITDEYLLECGFYSKKEYDKRQKQAMQKA